VRALPEPAAADLDLASVFHALGDPVREAGLTATVVVGRAHRMRLRTADLEDRFPGLLGTVLRAAGRDTAPVAAGTREARQE
jgi:hypothetical protein